MNDNDLDKMRRIAAKDYEFGEPILALCDEVENLREVRDQYNALLVKLNRLPVIVIPAGGMVTCTNDTQIVIAKILPRGEADAAT